MVKLMKIEGSMGLLNRDLKGGKGWREIEEGKKWQRESDREKDGNKRQEYVKRNHQVRTNFNVKHVPL